MIKKNKERRLARLQEEERLEADRVSRVEASLRGQLEQLFRCPHCPAVMAPPASIFQCRDGHTLCHQCHAKFKVLQPAAVLCLCGF